MKRATKEPFMSVSLHSRCPQWTSLPNRGKAPPKLQLLVSRNNPALSMTINSRPHPHNLTLARSRMQKTWSTTQRLNWSNTCRNKRQSVGPSRLKSQARNVRNVAALSRQSWASRISLIRLAQMTTVKKRRVSSDAGSRLNWVHTGTKMWSHGTWAL